MRASSLSLKAPVFFGALAVMGLILTAGCTQQSKVFFVEPVEGAKVTSPFTVKFGVKGMDVKPAGDMAEKTGHHHLIIEGGAVPEGELVPMDAKHIHFGQGQTETQVELPPGKHTLTMQFADGTHKSFGPKMSATISVEVLAPESK